jgi:aspartate kinase
MATIVQKYGGTSIGDPERIRGVAERIVASPAEGDRLSVVVSAMGDTTVDLMGLAG